MCGIAGLWGTPARDGEASARVQRMTAAIRHRGPDGESHWLGADVALGHTRLAIIDLETGSQPMTSADGETVIVFNGEIYNHAELRTRLEQHGYTFRTHSDTEVIAAAIAAWGIEAGLLSLRGMFAFALYQKATGRLLLARDRVGIKPLYWADLPGGVAFASEPKALLTLPLVSRQVNPTAIHDYLGTGYATTPATCWQGIQMLEPGTWLEIGRTGRRQGRYWQWHTRPDERLDLETATAQTEHTLLDAARAHLIADVPVGAFLSGGLDSSLLVSLLSPALVRDLPSFTVGFGDADFDESAAARAVAAQCQTVHHELHLPAGHGDPDLFERILLQYDEPFGDSSCIPTYLICREMRPHVKVVLSGDGGDEVLGGYPRYLHARRLEKLARLGPALPLLAGVSALAGGTAGRQLAKACQLARLQPHERLAGLHGYFSEADRAALYQPDFARLAQSAGSTASRFAAFVPQDVADPATQMMAAEMSLRLHADYLRKVDVASAAHGVEVRVPFLDNEMLDLAARLPTRLKITPRGDTKVLARRLAQRRLPAIVSNAPKRGFSLPLDRWSGPAMHEFLRALLLDRQAPVNQVLRPAAVERVWNDFAGDAAASRLSRYQRYQRLFMVAALALWLRRWNPTV